MAETRQNSLTTTRPIASASGIATQEMRSWSKQVSLMLVITGTGTPEGNVKGNSKQFYMNLTGTSGSILYIKQVDDVLGDNTKGWVLV